MSEIAPVATSKAPEKLGPSRQDIYQGKQSHHPIKSYQLSRLKYRATSTTKKYEPTVYIKLYILKESFIWDSQ